MVLNNHWIRSSKQAAVLVSSQRLTSSTEGCWNTGFFERNDATLVSLMLPLMHRDCEGAIPSCRSSPQDKSPQLVQATRAPLTQSISPTPYPPTQREVWVPPQTLKRLIMEVQ
ncbi:hypothetical protein BKA70DRAFT_1228566 [Coprinopsis sp. MPI-PUGE-AT-0042]|nr:hypothetical protein BKA70DRAFT_1228566 [Coprinopsis sp. MPI-PUGE-AT-0042]